MFYLKDNGKKLPISCDNVYTTCPQCGREHKVDLEEILESGEHDLDTTQVYCEECSAQREAEREAKRLKVCPGGADETVQAIAKRFHVDVKMVQDIVRSGMEAGLSANACYLGARLGLSMATGESELFSVEEVADALGCSVEEVMNQLHAEGVEPVTVATSPIFQAAIDEWKKERGLNE